MLALTGCNGLATPQAASDQLSIQQAPKARLTYVAIGASDTFGIGTSDPRTESWPADLAARLGPDVRLVNLGVPGIHVRQALNIELPVALDTHPDLITIWLAVNDLADNVPVAGYQHDLDLLLDRLQARLPHTHIAVANVPDLTLLPHFRSANTEQLHRQISNYNAAIATVVDKHHVLLVDLSQTWSLLSVHPEYISGDGFHPSNAGYAQLAMIFYQALQQNRP
ncbi:SGNH/GDSL hydrolase family protein [Ktedonosporobacter rubrisoli]|uniref:SGNH/GDSL hydrolase family protein n=1 Tax=Ktedonosporobacter rubrisoli TaxID=2509675 RepID=UPI0013EE9E47|nr:SGNH/GDSL hydrolase family protein [Ktedonosporobacter rubrisoli]